jgi:plastocyanin
MLWLWLILRSRERDLAKLRKQFELETEKKRRRSMRRSVFIASLAALILGTLGFGTGHKSYVASAQEKMSTMEVKIDNFSFGPATLTVPVGAKVTWTNRDDIPHTVVSTDDSKTFKSKVLDTDEKFSFTFSKAGTYPYFCSIHPKMTGKVIVQ